MIHFVTYFLSPTRWKSLTKPTFLKMSRENISPSQQKGMVELPGRYRTTRGFYEKTSFPYVYIYIYMGVSKNRGTSKSSILIGFSIINHPFWGTTIFGNTLYTGFNDVFISCLPLFLVQKMCRSFENSSSSAS